MDVLLEILIEDCGGARRDLAWRHFLLENVEVGAHLTEDAALRFFVPAQLRLVHVDRTEVVALAVVRSSIAADDKIIEVALDSLPEARNMTFDIF